MSRLYVNGFPCADNGDLDESDVVRGPVRFGSICEPEGNGRFEAGGQGLRSADR